MISEEDLRVKEAPIIAARTVATLNAEPTIEKPPADVPAPCAAYVGSWSGRWPFAGRIWLWVVSVDAKCVAQYAYTGSTAVPREYLTAEIKDGVLAIPRPGGTTTFQMRGEDLLGRYAGSDGCACKHHGVGVTDRPTGFQRGLDA